MLEDDPPPQVSNEDLALLALIASYGLRDVDEIGGRRNGKAADGPPSDEELAFHFFAEEAQALRTFVSDSVFARSLDQALQTDTNLLEEHERIEEVARGDREVARTLTEGRRPAAQPSGSSLSKRSSPSTLATFTSATESSTALFGTRVVLNC